MKLQDRFWLWGQDAGSHHAASANKSWKLPGVNKMGPAEGAAYLGIKNVCRVVMGGAPEPPFDAETEKLRFADQVVWSAVGDASSGRYGDNHSDLDEVLRQAAKYPNVTGAVLDDFFQHPDHNGGKVARHSLDSLRGMAERLHGFKARPLALWVVWYKGGLDWPVGDYLGLCDVITYWNMWAAAKFKEIDDDFAKLVAKTPGKRRLAGCYLWNYGEGKPLTIAETRAQCEKYHGWIRDGSIEGVIFCSNCCADLGLEAVAWARDWIKEVGAEEVAD